MYVKLGRAKLQPSSARGTFSNWGLNEGGRKFSEKRAFCRLSCANVPMVFLIIHSNDDQFTQNFY